MIVENLQHDLPFNLHLCADCYSHSYFYFGIQMLMLASPHPSGNFPWEENNYIDTTLPRKNHKLKIWIPIYLVGKKCTTPSVFFKLKQKRIWVLSLIIKQQKCNQLQLFVQQHKTDNSYLGNCTENTSFLTISKMQYVV